MNSDQIEKFEKLLERKLDAEEITRLQHVKSVLKISDNDALWDILIAFEYQKKFYQELPDKINTASKELIDALGSAAEKQTALAQAKLVEEIKVQAKKISLKENLHEIVSHAAMISFCVLFYGAACMWVGFSIGSGQTHPPTLLLKMPAGFVIAGLVFSGGIALIYKAATTYAAGKTVEKIPALSGLGLVALGATILGITL